MSLLFSAHLQKASGWRDRAAGGVEDQGLRASQPGGGTGYICHGHDCCPLGHLDRIVARIPPTWPIRLSQCNLETQPFSKCALSISVARSHKVNRATELPDCTFAFLVAPHHGQHSFPCLIWRGPPPRVYLALSPPVVEVGATPMEPERDF